MFIINKAFFITLYKNVCPSKYNWIGAGSGIGGIEFNFAASKKYIRGEVYIDRGNIAIKIILSR